MKYLRKFPLLDLFALGIVFLFMIINWEDAPSPDSTDPAVIKLFNTMNEDSERQIALATVQGTINSCIAGVSIMLAAIAAVTGIRSELDEKAKSHFKISALFCVISLIAGVCNMGVLPQLVKYNLAYDKSVAALLIIQIYTLFFGGFRLLCAIFQTIK